MQSSLKAQEFEVIPTPTCAFLKWRWADAKVPDHFEIERRTRGSNFEMISIGFLLQDTDTAFLHYKDKLTGNNEHYYYRIKAVYPDGNADYSEIVSVSLADLDKKIIDARLDNKTGKLKLSLPPLNGAYICRVYDMNGVLVSVEKPEACSPEITFNSIEGNSFFIESFHPLSGKKFYSTFSRN
ncbi:MAG: hypothetical protein KGP35_00615 [Bacteroidetes bacterium]|nr:hypothetical protein [Bacteroidota bacterium]